MNTPNIQYSAGNLGNPTDQDPRFENQQLALDAALASNAADVQAKDWDNVRAVWEDESGEILFLVHGGIVYKPA